MSDQRIIPPRPKYPGPFLYLLPAQWEAFERAGFDMQYYRVRQEIPLPALKIDWPK